MTGEPGTIVELDPYDALGWIALDSGGRVRFGGTALRDFGVRPGVGARVAVHGIGTDHRGFPRALAVRPIAPTGPAAARPAGPGPIAWPTFVRTHPQWSDVAELCVAHTQPAARPELTPHPLFTPWLAELRASAPTVVPLGVPGFRQQAPIEPTIDDSFAHGRVAYLEQPSWPACGVCERPLEMCVQLSPAVLAAFVPGGRGLVALFCFHCAAKPEPRTAYVRLVAPQHRVTCPADAPASASSGWLAATQRVTAGPPVSTLPGSSFHRHRSTRRPTLAASRLFGFGAPAVTGPLPPGADPRWFDALGLHYDAWIAGSTGTKAWGGAQLGGPPVWDQTDRTPACVHGEMPHLLAYEGGQFLDGALHVLLCREHACAPAFVAEF